MSPFGKQIDRATSKITVKTAISPGVIVEQCPLVSPNLQYSLLRSQLSLEQSRHLWHVPSLFQSAPSPSPLLLSSTSLRSSWTTSASLSMNRWNGIGGDCRNCSYGGTNNLWERYDSQSSTPLSFASKSTRLSDSPLHFGDAAWNDDEHTISSTTTKYLWPGLKDDEIGRIIDANHGLQMADSFSVQEFSDQIDAMNRSSR